MKIFGKVLSVVYTILFTIVLLILSVSLFASNFFKDSFYADMLKNVNFDEIPADVIGLGEEGKTLKESLVDILNGAGVNKKVADEILDDEQIKEVLGNLIGDIARYSANGENLPQLKKEDLEKVINNKSVKELLPDDFNTNDLVKGVNETLKENIEGGY